MARRWIVNFASNRRCTDSSFMTTPIQIMNGLQRLRWPLRLNVREFCLVHFFSWRLERSDSKKLPIIAIQIMNSLFHIQCSLWTFMMKNRLVVRCTAEPDAAPLGSGKQSVLNPTPRQQPRFADTLAKFQAKLKENRPPAEINIWSTF
jgi:hypothetical protein